MNNKKRGEISATIVSSRDLGAEYQSLVMEVPEEASKWIRNVRPGQFVQIACSDTDHYSPVGTFLRRPFSIASLQTEDNRVQLEVIYNVIGPGTGWMAQRKSGDPVNILAPLGNGFAQPQEKQTKVILAGGGIGIPPVLFLADALKKQGFENIVGFAGMRSLSNFEYSINSDPKRDSRPLEPSLRLEQWNRSGTPSVIATDDGSYGFSGNLVEALDQYLANHSDWTNAEIFTCGPEPMLKAMAQLAGSRNMTCHICMEAYMACGFGVCQSCVVPVKIDKENSERSGDNMRYALVCDAGPVFDAEELLWE